MDDTVNKDHYYLNIPLHSKDFEDLKKHLPNDVWKNLDIRRSLTIMNEVKKSEGKTFLEKVDNTIERFNKGNSNVRQGSNDDVELENIML